jgi:hypothetical protein
MFVFCMCLCLCVCVRVCVRACVRECCVYGVCVCVCRIARFTCKTSPRLMKRSSKPSSSPDGCERRRTPGGGGGAGFTIARREHGAGAVGGRKGLWGGRSLGCVGLCCGGRRNRRPRRRAKRKRTSKSNWRLRAEWRGGVVRGGRGTILASSAQA